jgi:uncharacterized protein YjiS (DUF1127 family)
MLTMGIINEMVNRSYTIVQWLSTVILEYFDRYQRRKEYRRTIYELSKLSERELRDIGLSHGQILSVAYSTSYRSFKHV